MHVKDFLALLRVRLELAFPDNLRICQVCDTEIEIEDGMDPGDEFVCDCGALGQFKLFPCPKPACMCAGWLGLDYTKKEEAY